MVDDHLDPDQREQWDIGLYDPLPGFSSAAAAAEAEERVAELEMEAFARAMGQQ